MTDRRITFSTVCNEFHDCPGRGLFPSTRSVKGQPVRTVAWAVSISILACSVVTADPRRDFVIQAESQRVATIERITPSVVAVFDSARRGGGSGVLIDEAGYGLTNYHVVAGMFDTRRGVGGLSDGELYELQVLGIDPTGDVAMFRLVGRDRFPRAELGDSDAVRVGDTAIVLGNPFSLSEDYSPSVTLGIVTGIHRYQRGVQGNLVYSDCLQVDAPVNPGNSGGPLFNAAGEVVGINGRISLKPREPLNPRGRFNVGVGYAIAANQIKRFIPALRAGLLARHGTLQATLEHRPEEGIVFAKMLRRGPAYKAGIRLGDRIISFDRKAITSPNHFASLIGAYPADWEVPITVQRSGERIEVVVRLDPIDSRLTTRFTVDQDVNLRQVKRVLRAHRKAVLSHPKGQAPQRCAWTVTREYAAADDAPLREPQAYQVSYERGEPIRMQFCSIEGDPGAQIEYDDVHAVQRDQNGQDTAELMPDTRAILGALFVLQQGLLTPVDQSDLTAVSHLGGNRLLRGPGLVEVIQWPIGESASADFWFDARTHLVVRVEVHDAPTGAEATIDLFDYRDVGGVRRACTIQVSGPDYLYRDTLTDWEVAW